MGYRYAEAEEITICEYSYEMYAWNLRTIEEHRQINMLAWQINQASAEKKQGKKIVPAFKSFDEFDKTKQSLENLKRGYGDTKAQKILEKKTDLIELLRQANSGGA